MSDDDPEVASEGADMDTEEITGVEEETLKIAEDEELEATGEIVADENTEQEADPDDQDSSAVHVEMEASETSRTASKKFGRSSPTSGSGKNSPVSEHTTTSHMAKAQAAQAAAAAVSAQAAAAAAQAALIGGMTGLSTLLATSSNMPSVDQVRQAATKAVNDSPPYVHMSSRDSAPQLKIEDGPLGRRLLVRGGMRGYRMARATHGVSEGNYYYEVLVLPSPTAKELVASLPPNVRLGRTLQSQLQDQLVREEQEGQARSSGDTDSDGTGRKTKKRKLEESEAEQSISVGGHIRIGWSMRTGDLQAPVGYDKWSYGLRDIAGSRVHNSRREDRWGGEPFGPGDVVGFAISLVGPESKSEETGNATSKKSTATNHIRFFKNGEAMGHFIISKGKREGGAAFDSIQDGTYYPAVSSYMGGSMRVNFGPYFVYPPRMLPSGMKVAPLSDLYPPPPTPDDAVAKAVKERAFSKKIDDAVVTSFTDAIHTESQIRYDAYTNHLSRHIEEVREARQENNMSTGDLPLPEKVEESETEEVDMDVEKTDVVLAGAAQ